MAFRIFFLLTLRSCSEKRRAEWAVLHPNGLLAKVPTRILSHDSNPRMWRRGVDAGLEDRWLKGRIHSIERNKGRNSVLSRVWPYCVTSSYNPLTPKFKKYIREAVRIGSMLTFHLNKLWKAKFLELHINCVGVCGETLAHRLKVDQGSNGVTSYRILSRHSSHWLITFSLQPNVMCTLACAQYNASWWTLSMLLAS